VLRQNPRFHAAMTSPLAALWSAILPKMSGGSEFASFFDNPRRQSVLRGVFDGYYQDLPTDRVIFDTNRTWTGKAAMLKTLFPESKIVCCVREVPWIIDSIERMLRKNPLQMSRLMGFQAGSSVYSRVEVLMNSETGLIGTAWSTFREAWFSENAGRLIVVNYDRFVDQPQETIDALYAALGESPFAHDFNHVTYDEPDYDAALGMPGMHKVRESIEPDRREACIPPDIFSKYADTNFWLKPELNRRGAILL
jgi:sulfotransferase